MKVASDWVNNNGYVAKTGSSSLKNTVMSGRSMVSRRGVHRGILHETGPIDRHGLRGGQLSLPLCNDHSRASAVNRPRARNRQLLWFLWFSFVVPTPRGSKCIWSCLNRYGFHRTYNSMGMWSGRNSFIAWILYELVYVWRCLQMFEDVWRCLKMFEDVWRCLNFSRFGGLWLNFLRNGVWSGTNSIKVCISCESKLLESWNISCIIWLDSFWDM